MPSPLAITINPELAEKRLDVVLAESNVGLTRSHAKALIADGHVQIDGSPAAKASQLLHVGQIVSVEIPEPEKIKIEAREIKGIRILFEDESLAVLEKPAGISVHPSTTETGDTVVHGLLHSLKSLSSIGGIERPGIVHRLDKGTSGVLVVSKTDEAHLGLSRQFKAHSINRRYRALVYGDLFLKSRSGTIETFFGRHPIHRKKMTGKLPAGRKAITHWTALERFMIGTQVLTLVELRLETGRTHQIRAHLSEFGFGIVGDPLYGDHARKAKQLALESPSLSSVYLGLTHQLLHAFLLEFTHPGTGKRVRFTSTLPPDFENAIVLARNEADTRRGIR